LICFDLSFSSPTFFPSSHFDELLCTQVVTKLVTKLDLSESDVSNAALTVISTSCPSLQTIDLNAAKTNRTAVSSQGLHSDFYLLVILFISMLLFGFANKLLIQLHTLMLIKFVINH